MLNDPKWDEQTGKIDCFKSAKELKLSKKQYDALVKTLKLFESGHPKIDDKEIIFNMSRWQYDSGTCGTYCCIGGTASLIAGEYDIFGDHSKALENLFHRWGNGPVCLETGAKGLRKYLETGECPYDWAKIGWV